MMDMSVAAGLVGAGLILAPALLAGYVLGRKDRRADRQAERVEEATAQRRVLVATRGRSLLGALADHGRMPGNGAGYPPPPEIDFEAFDDHEVYTWGGGAPLKQLGTAGTEPTGPVDEEEPPVDPGRHAFVADPGPAPAPPPMPPPPGPLDDDHSGWPRRFSPVLASRIALWRNRREVRRALRTTSRLLSVASRRYRPSHALTDASALRRLATTSWVLPAGGV